MFAAPVCVAVACLLVVFAASRLSSLMFVCLSVCLSSIVGVGAASGDAAMTSSEAAEAVAKYQGTLIYVVVARTICIFAPVCLCFAFLSLQLLICLVVVWFV